MTLSTRREFCKPPDELAALSDGCQDGGMFDASMMVDVRMMVRRLEPRLRVVAESRWIDGLTRREVMAKYGLTRWEAWKRERQAREFIQAEWGRE